MTKEEIESLGWIHDDCEPNNYVKGEWDLFHNPITNHIKIDDADGCFIAFEGVIDDISTLKKIMANLEKEYLSTIWRYSFNTNKE